ncbi:hypothetical protein [Chroococcidiopsis thermalis]|uniref:hypothetical protein n=1 Tax=Chroococcidiopsis thermalis TaxID=54299 RepID=UPI0015F0217A|nr:hypothetical protein [Chroococcidiopsis thermalis]
MLSLETHKVQHRSLILTILRRSQKSEVKIEETGDRRKIRGTRGTRGIRGTRGTRGNSGTPRPKGVGIRGRRGTRGTRGNDN